MNIDFEFACRDDCLEKMVPSDLRKLVIQRDALIGLLDAFTGNAPSPMQWKLACEKAAKLRAALDAERKL